MTVAVPWPQHRGQGLLAVGETGALTLRTSLEITLMNFANVIRDIGRGKQAALELEERQAEALFGAILDGGVPELELGAMLAALRLKGETTGEMSGFRQACRNRLNRLERPPGRPRPVVLPTYNGARRGANLTPLLGLLLQRFGIPVLLHGSLESYGRVTSAQILRELGILPASSVAQVKLALAGPGLAFAPTAVFSPALAELLALRARLGLRNVAHSLVKMLDPFDGEGLLIAAATHPPYLESMREILVAAGANALLLRATEGEPHANPKRRPCIELIHDSAVELLFEAEHDTVLGLPGLPDDADAATTARWTRSLVAGESPVPMPILNQVAACLYGCGCVFNLAQAKALVAVELHAHPNTCQH